MITEVRLPQEGVNDTSAVVLGWSVEDGQRVAAGEDLLEVETSKVTVAVAAPGDGYVVHAVPAEQVAEVGDVLAYLCGDHDELADARARVVARPRSEPTESQDGQRFSASARKYLAEHGITPERFTGRTLVTLQDVLDEVGGDEPAEQVSHQKAVEIQRLTNANVLNAALTVQFDGSGIRRWASTADVPSVRRLAAVVRAVALSLVAHPGLNAWYDNGIRRYAEIGVGVAVDLDDGLRVGVVCQADRLGVDDIARRIGEIVSGYLNETLTLADVSGGTVTVSDLSVDDVLTFQPLLNDRQGLAIGVGGDESLPGQPLTLTATFDHRVSTGREVSQFLAMCRRLVNETAASSSQGATP